MSKAAFRDWPVMEVSLPILPQVDKKESAADQRDVSPAVEITGSLFTGKPLSILNVNMTVIHFNLPRVWTAYSIKLRSLGKQALSTNQKTMCTYM